MWSGAARPRLSPRTEAGRKRSNIFKGTHKESESQAKKGEKKAAERETWSSEIDKESPGDDVQFDFCTS